MCRAGDSHQFFMLSERKHWFTWVESLCDYVKACSISFTDSHRTAVFVYLVLFWKSVESRCLVPLLFLRERANHTAVHRPGSVRKLLSQMIYMDLCCDLCFCRQPCEPDLPSVLWLQRRRKSSHLLDEGREVHWGPGWKPNQRKRNQVRRSSQWHPFFSFIEKSVSEFMCATKLIYCVFVHT